MALQQDLVMRMIAKLSRAFQALLTNEKIDTRDALEFIAEAVAEALHTRKAWITMVAPGKLEELPAEVCAHLGRLYLEWARRHPNPDERRKATSLALAGLSRGAAVSLDPLAPEVLAAHTLRDVLEDDELDRSLVTHAQYADAYTAMFNAFREVDELESAEDALFNAIEFHTVPTDLALRGIEWYDSLLARRDEELEELGLPRDEALQARQDLRDELA